MSTWNDEHYFDWLYEFIADRDAQEPEESFVLLAEQMYLLPFRWSLSHDANRAEDGIQLRYRYASEFRIPLEDIPTTPCSFLEMLIALCERALYISDEFLNMHTPDDWFMHLMHNAGLIEFADSVYYGDYSARSRVHSILVRVMDHHYSYTGEGGLFPIPRAEEDMRHVELWYQMNKYISSKIEWVAML